MSKTETHLCDFIREDAFECAEKANWIISPNSDPYDYTYACNNHLPKLAPKDDTSYLGFLS